MASEYVEAAPPRRRAMRTTLIVALIAFLAGLVAMGLALREWGGDLGLTRTIAPPAATMPALAPAPRVVTIDPVSADQLTVRVRELEERLARISVSAEAASNNAGRAEGLLVAFAARRALDRGLELGYLETQLRDRFGQAQPRAVGIILAAAREPTTLEGLQSDFARLAPELTTPAAQRNWWQGVQREFSELVIVRRAGTPSPAAGERIERAERALDDGVVERALAEVARMPGRAKAEAWMANARRYVEARRALDIVETAAIIAPRGGTGNLAESSGASEARAVGRP